MPEQISSVYAVMIAAITAISSAKAWEFWLKRLQLRHASENSGLQEKNMFRDDLIDRVDDLQEKLEQAQAKILQLHQTINKLSVKLAKTEVRVEFLEKENLALVEANDIGVAG